MSASIKHIPAVKVEINKRFFLQDKEKLYLKKSSRFLYSQVAYK